jgi:hypothetical protein
MRLLRNNAKKLAVIEEIDRTRRSAKGKPVKDDKSKRLRELIDFLNANCFSAVQLETNVAEASIDQTLVNHFEGCHFFRNK